MQIIRKLLANAGNMTREIACYSPIVIAKNGRAQDA